MDPITQAAFGATAAQNTAKATTRKQLLTASILGICGGMAPDLDVLIRSSTDPLLFLQYHRHFSHSLFFIPIGGTIVGFLLYWLFAKHRGFSLKASIGFATAGYATHALLDACTTYGTLLLWPLNNVRYSWNTVSVIDPAVTLPVLILLITHFIKNQVVYARLAVLWIAIYLSLGWVQRERAEDIGLKLATDRRHTPTQLSAKPSFANILLWKIVYEYEGKFYVDAVRVGLSTKVYPGESIHKLNLQRDLVWLKPDSVQAKDVARFDWFSQRYLALDPQVENRIIDIRYSLLPNQIAGLWSIQLNPSASHSSHAAYTTHRERSEATMNTFWAMLKGEDISEAP